MGGPAAGIAASLDARPEASRAGAVAPDPSRSGWLVDALAQRGIGRRQFLGFCASAEAARAIAFAEGDWGSQIHDQLEAVARELAGGDAESGVWADSAVTAEAGR